MARPVPGRGETRDRGHPRGLSETNGMHGASGYRVRTDAEHATPLAGPTYRARTRYRLAGPRSAGETLPTGMRDRPAVPRWNPRPSGRGGCQPSTRDPCIRPRVGQSRTRASTGPSSAAQTGGRTPSVSGDRRLARGRLGANRGAALAKRDYRSRPEYGIGLRLSPLEDRNDGTKG